ncbi:MAG: site-specific DNA-methyltransferase, partial [Halanaeroarchaeum sp.]
METNHHVVAGDARDLPLADGSVELVVTSPPYPMIEMWDETFAGLDPAIGDALAEEDGALAYDLMHEILDAAWQDVARVL